MTAVDVDGGGGGGAKKTGKYPSTKSRSSNNNATNSQMAFRDWLGKGDSAGNEQCTDG